MNQEKEVPDFFNKMHTIRENIKKLNLEKIRLEKEILDQKSDMSICSINIRDTFDVRSLVGNDRVNNRPFKHGRLNSMDQFSILEENMLNVFFNEKNGHFSITDSCDAHIMNKEEVLNFMEDCSEDLSELKKSDSKKFETIFSEDSYFLVLAVYEYWAYSDSDLIYEYSIFKIN